MMRELAKENSREEQMARETWQDFDQQRLALPRPISRAELARRAGVAESTATKGLAKNARPITRIRDQLRLVLEAERMLQGAAPAAAIDAGEVAHMAAMLERALGAIRAGEAAEGDILAELAEEGAEIGGGEGRPLTLTMLGISVRSETGRRALIESWIASAKREGGIA